LKDMPWFYTVSLIIALLLLGPLAVAEHPTRKVISVDVLGPFASPQEQELLFSLKQNLLDKYDLGLKQNLLFWQKQPNWATQLQNSEADYIITVGQEGLDRIMKQSTGRPVIAVMNTADSIETLRKKPHDNFYAITHEQPLVRYFALIKSLNIYQAQTASFFSDQNSYLKTRYSQISRFFNLPYKPLVVNPHLKALDAISQLSDCCRIMLHDSDRIYPPGRSRKSLLVNSFQHRIIVIGNSQSMLQEGAMLALFSRPYTIGEQTADLIYQIEKGQVKERYQYPDKFVLDANRRIAKLLGFSELTLGELIGQIEMLENLYYEMEQ
jgi:ABC-type uncharacterized transport system substrate-binding protein